MNDTCPSLLERIPHRSPFLFVDEILEASESRIVTRTLVRPDADFFRGHYPGNPIMPGVLLCECCFQSGAALLLNRAAHVEGRSQSQLLEPSPLPLSLEGRGVSELATQGPTPVLTRIGDARFKRLVRPGETLNTEVILDDAVDKAYSMTARMTSNGQQVLRVTFTCMLVANGAHES
ncbi:MAG: beta-hydroxyacyl-ACP dehydratase [Planctomycetes bacterium]|nr:beta-hydroxyacyl-ACP dehydratase [Planctomycetota bacterium]MBI3833230.1 beta-hydroxyacyl-ACP dehydratase [Planctomycetota bacterium]